MEISRESYADAKRSIKEFYRVIGQIWCPVLNDYVAFTRGGLDHLIGKKDIIRPRSEQRRRFLLLHHVPAVLQNPNAHYSYELKIINDIYIRYWIFTATINDIPITILIKQTPKGKKQFLTVYGKKQKSTP